MEWLSDRVLNAFGRHTAPVIRLPDKLAADEHIILMHGGFPNRRGHVLIQDWVGVRLQGTQVVEQLDWVDVASRLDLRPGKLANRGQAGDTAALRALLLPPAVDVACLRLRALKERFEVERKDALEAQRQHHIDRVFRDYRDWLDNTQTTEDDPYLQAVAVFTGQTAKEQG
ncbi:hypothetical protein [Nitrococcus mobilis]|uniref:ATP-dependent helicase n=1 Tax=Nitrococcus mobilis Nb-231 TaxID=314278 RepID=A4BL16_9GAMM|nr:hypothetical protein [Nitrococcus mobilis]EAR23004.1 ATP-dependent helicase [Nitrococcus mobilis Nb-231]